MRAALALLAAACAASGGCLVHRARVAPAPEAPGGGVSAVATRVQTAAPAAERSGPLPHELPVTWAVRDGEGRLCLLQAVVQSPLPWWQRFPCDLLIDLWPGEVAVTVEAQLQPRPVVPRPHADIIAEAKAHGYAD